MTRDRLRLPLKLARQALDQARARLVTAVDQRQTLERTLLEIRDARGRETADETSELHVLASFVERTRSLERELIGRLAAAETEERERLEAVRERRAEVRRLELLDERLADEARLAAERQAQRELDTFVTMRASRR